MRSGRTAGCSRTGIDIGSEVGTLARVFNQMTGQLEQQNTALVSANAQLENRRALIEAVMAGVSAGVIATAPGRTIQIANRSAGALQWSADGKTLFACVQSGPGRVFAITGPWGRQNNAR